MKKKRCQICEGRLVNGRCEVCGMPYRNDEERYHLNEPRREQKAYTAVSGRKTADQRERPQRKAPAAGYAGSRKRPDRNSPKKNRLSKLLLLIVVIFMLAPVLVGLVEYIAFDEGATVEEIEENNEWKHELLEESQAQGTAPFEGTFAAGRYVIGQQLPAGIYHIEMGEADEEEEMEYNLADTGNGLYEFWVFSHTLAETEDYLIEEMEDAVLLEGGVLELTGKCPLIFSTEEGAFTENYQMAENPLEEEYLLAEKMEAGKDIEPGYYDLKLLAGTGAVTIEFPEGWEEGNSQSYYMLSADSVYGMTDFVNLKLPKGARILTEGYSEEFQAKLVSSERIYEER